MESYLFYGMEAAPDSLIVEGYHKPGSLTIASGAWIHAAGRAMLEEGEHALNPHHQYVWLTVESGEAVLTWKDRALTLQSSDTCIIPVGDEQSMLKVSGDTMILWMSFEGPLAATVVRKMGALLHVPLTQHVLPSQIYVAQQIVQVIFLLNYVCLGGEKAWIS